MESPPQSTDGAAAPVELQPLSIDGMSAEIKSVEEEKSTAVEMSAVMGKHSQMENCTEKSNGKIEASNGKIDSAQIENSAETKKSTAEKFGCEELQPQSINGVSGEIESVETKKSDAEKFGREVADLMHRLDPSGAVSIMCLASPLYAVLAVWPLWLFADQPQAFLWTFAHLTCLYLSLWIITLSTTSISTVFFRITYVLMLAFTAVHLIGPMNGMIFLYTGMIYVAGTLGYAVAEHFQRAGFEKTANALCSSPINSKDCEKDVPFMHFVTVMMSLPILARMAWIFLVPYSGHIAHMDVIQVLVELTGEIFIIALLWIIYITQIILRGALVSMETFLWSACICCFACYSLAMLLSFNVAEAVGMLVMCLGSMALGGFFGYSLAVRALYCKMLARIDTTPAAKEQNGGTW